MTMIQSYREPTAYVQHMIEELKLTLSAAQRSAYVAAATMVHNAQKHVPLDIKAVHHVMLAADDDLVCQGVFRASRTLSVFGVEQGTAKPAAVPFLMDRFLSTYETIVMVPQSESRAYQVAWTVSAFARVVHPFVCGNTRLFLLVENHIRQVHQVPWRYGMPEKVEFEKVRQAVIRTYPQCFFEPGAS